MLIDLGNRSKRVQVGPPILGSARLAVLLKSGLPLGDIRARMKAEGSLTAEVSQFFDMTADMDGSAVLECSPSFWHDIHAPISSGATMNCAFDPFGPPDDYIAYWTFDDLTGAEELGAYNGTWNGSPTNVAGVVNNAVDASASATYMTTPSNFPTIPGGLRSLTCLINIPQNAGATQYHILQYAGFEVNSSFNNININLRADSPPVSEALYLRYYRDDDLAGLDTGFNFLCLTTDGVLNSSADLKIYINGTDVTSSWTKDTRAGTPVIQTTNVMYIAGFSAGAYGSTTIDELKAWNYTLSAEQQLAMYNAYFP